MHRRLLIVKPSEGSTVPVHFCRKLPPLLLYSSAVWGQLLQQVYGLIPEVFRVFPSCGLVAWVDLLQRQKTFSVSGTPSVLSHCYSRDIRLQVLLLGKLQAD